MSKKKNEMKKRYKMVQAHTHTHIKKKTNKKFMNLDLPGLCIILWKKSTKKVTFEIGILYVYHTNVCATREI